MRARFVEVFRTQSLLGYLREFVNSPKKGLVDKKTAPHADKERFKARSDAVQRNQLRIRFDVLYWI